MMSLNLRFGLAEDGPNNWELRDAAYPELLKQYPCDFYAFQEANDFQITFLAGLLPNHEYIGQRWPAPKFWQNNVIFHHRRWRRLNCQHFYLSETPDIPSQFSRSRWPRQCTMGTFADSNRQLTVINTHFDFDADVQRLSAMLIGKRLDTMAPGLPAVLMGDLNAGPGSSCMQVFTADDVNFRSALWPPPAGTHHGFTGQAKDEAIDWILYRGALKALHAEVITSRYCGYYPSDHFPLTAQFRWQP